VNTTLFALQKVRDVFLREQRSLANERAHLLKWGSLLKQQTTSEKEKAAERWEWLDEKQCLLTKEEITIDELDTEAQKLRACASTTIKQQEDLNALMVIIDQRE
jgi:hypothetical protein